MKTRHLALLAGLGLLGTACEDGDGTQANARQVTSRHELIGGPTALGEVGDFLLENDLVRVIIQGPGFSRGFGVYGGSLIDADLRRPQRPGDDSGGRGLDLFGELFPVFFVQALVPETVEVLNDGKNGDAASIVVKGHGGDFLSMTRTLNQVITNSHQILADGGQLLPTLMDVNRPDGKPNLGYEMVYELPPGERYLELRATLKNESGAELQMPWPQVAPLLGALLGTTAPFRVPCGSVLLFGAGNKVFVPGSGYGVRWLLEDNYKTASEKGLGFPALPGLVTPGLVSTSTQGVSYGFFALPDPQVTSYVKDQTQVVEETMEVLNRYTETYGVEVGDDSMLIPFLASAFTAVFYGEAPATLPAGGSFTYTNYFVIGDGDAASVMNTVYRLRGLETEELTGEVIDELSGAPLEQASVLIYAGGRPVNQLYTDASGRFRGRMPAGSYEARVERDPLLSDPVKFDLKSGGKLLRLSAPSAAKISVHVSDAHGNPIPAKVSVVGHYDAKHAGEEPRRFLFDLSAGQRWRHTDLTKDDAAEPSTLAYLETFGFTGRDGDLTLTVPPDVPYDVWVSRGPEYSVDRIQVTPKLGRPAQIVATLEHVMKTPGYIAADFHMHADPSLDSDLSLEERVESSAANGLEWLVATDHNFVTDYQPTIDRLGLSDWMKSMVGIEMTTLESGHFNGFPIRRDVEEITKGSMEWSLKTPDEVFDAIRRQGSLSEDDTIVQVNHPRDSILGYFEQYDFNALTATVDPLPSFDFGNLAHPNGRPFFDEEGNSTFSLNFDAMELFNGGVVGEVHHAVMPASIEGLEIPRDTVVNLPETPGTILCEDDGQVAFPGAIDDWFNLLNQGQRYTGTGNSDSHEAHDVGVPRTYVRVGTDDPRLVNDRDIVDAFRRHDAIITNGPFLEMFIDGKRVGQELRSADAEVDVRIEIAAADWVDVQRGVVFANGKAIERFAVKMDPESGKFTHTFKATVAADTWFVAEVEGDRNLFPMAPPLDIPPVQIDDALASVAGPLGFGASPFGQLEPGPTQVWRPFALTNPIWVNVGSDDWQAPGVLNRVCHGLGVVEMPAGMVEKARGLTPAQAEKRRIKRALRPSVFGAVPRVHGDYGDVRTIFQHFSHGH